MRQNYPVISQNPTQQQVATFLQTIQRLRQVEDLPDWTNLPNLYVSGRSSHRIPLGSTDVVVGDRIGDQIVAVDGSYLYMLISASGTATWARIALDTAW